LNCSADTCNYVANCHWGYWQSRGTYESVRNFTTVYSASGTWTVYYASVSHYIPNVSRNALTGHSEEASHWVRHGWGSAGHTRLGDIVPNRIGRSCSGAVASQVADGGASGTDETFKVGANDAARWADTGSPSPREGGIDTVAGCRIQLVYSVDEAVANHTGIIGALSINDRDNVTSTNSWSGVPSEASA